MKGSDRDRFISGGTAETSRAIGRIGNAAKGRERTSGCALCCEPGGASALLLRTVTPLGPKTVQKGNAVAHLPGKEDAVLRARLALRVPKHPLEISTSAWDYVCVRAGVVIWSARRLAGLKRWIKLSNRPTRHLFCCVIGAWLRDWRCCELAC